MISFAVDGEDASKENGAGECSRAHGRPAVAHYGCVSLKFRQLEPRHFIVAMTRLLKLFPMAMLLSACISGVLAEDVADEATFELDCDQNLVVTAPSKIKVYCATCKKQIASFVTLFRLCCRVSRFERMHT